MGWDIDRFPEGEVNLELICCICTCILEDPVESPCRHVFCSKCIKTWLSNQKSCPHCRASVHKRELQSVVPLLKNIISKQRIFCDNKENGCDEIVPLETLQTHVASCQYSLTTCTNEGCSIRVMRKDFKNHIEICSKRTVLCEDGCEMLLKLGERSTHNCIQALRAHFQEVQNEMLSRISKLEELVNVLVSKASTISRDGSRTNGSSDTYQCVPYTIPSPRSYENRPPPYSVYPDIHDSTINLTSYPLEQNDLSDSVESIESDHDHENDYSVRQGRQTDSPVERPMSPVYDHLERRSFEHIFVSRDERRRSESRRERQRSRSPHFRNRNLDTTYTRNNSGNIRSDRENRHNRTFDRVRRENNDEEIVLRLGVSQAVSDSSTTSSSSSGSDTD